MMKIGTFRKAAALAVLAVFAAGFAGAALAKTEWEKNHPRRAEVNRRLDHQDRRINNDAREGKITRAQARKLHREDHQIRQEERDMASQNGGHITKQEQRALNQQENAVRKQIP